MSQTEQRFTLLDQEYQEFIEGLVAKAVEEPIERFRESTTAELSSSTGELVRAQGALVKMAEDLNRRLSERLDRAVETLESSLEGVADLEDLRRLESEARKLVQATGSHLGERLESARLERQEERDRFERLLLGIAGEARSLAEGVRGLSGRLEAESARAQAASEKRTAEMTELSLLATREAATTRQTIQQGLGQLRERLDAAAQREERAADASDRSLQAIHAAVEGRHREARAILHQVLSLEQVLGDTLARRLAAVDAILKRQNNLLITLITLVASLALLGILALSR